MHLSFALAKQPRNRGVSVILGDISSNVMFPPFAPRPKARPDTLEMAIVTGRLAAADSLLPFNADSLSVPWIDLGYGVWSMRALTSRWPFEEMPRRRDVLDGCEDWELQLVKDIYAGKVGWTDACLQYADKARRHMKESAAVTALSALVEEYPWVYVFRYGLATALENVGRTPEAIDQFGRSRCTGSPSSLSTATAPPPLSTFLKNRCVWRPDIRPRSTFGHRSGSTPGNTLVRAVVPGA